MNITVLDYGAGNVRSIRNAIRKLGYTVQEVHSAEDIINAEKLVFPGVGSFGQVMENLTIKGYKVGLYRRIAENKPFFGICVALQALYAGSQESPGVMGLGIIDGIVRRFAGCIGCADSINDDGKRLSVPQIGWNGVNVHNKTSLFSEYNDEKLYFVHSYYAPVAETPDNWVIATTDYGTRFVSAVERGNIAAVQFHPEKSGEAGLHILGNYLGDREQLTLYTPPRDNPEQRTAIAKRIIACLDVRNNDDGDLVVTKGDQYDVRSETDSGAVRNMGKPVALSRRYYKEGADEITLLNITGFRNFPMNDQPMITLLRELSEEVFVPLTIGGGIREFDDENGKHYTALDVAASYFQAGADKVSIGSDAVYAVEEYLHNDCCKTGNSSIEQISAVYGVQAVVISVDPKRVYVASPANCGHTTIKTKQHGPAGEKYCWYQCTVCGGREGRNLDVIQLVTCCEALGAGEILLNCIDRDGTNGGFDLELADLVKNAVKIPVILSSGAGNSQHFVEAFTQTDVDAALAAGIFHRQEVTIQSVKKSVADAGIEIR